MREEVAWTSIALLSAAWVSVEICILSVVATTSMCLARLCFGVGSFGLDVFVQAIVLG
jgi:hypothetical protein